MKFGAGQTGMGSGISGGSMCSVIVGVANAKVDMKKVNAGVTITSSSSYAAAIHVSHARGEITRQEYERKLEELRA
jgi:uncharacterized membrane protein